MSVDHKFNLLDGSSNCIGSLGGRVSVMESGIEIYFDSYGTCDTEDTNGAPVYIEFYDGKLRVIINTDINTEDQMFVDLDGAREALRDVDS